MLCALVPPLLFRCVADSRHRGQEEEKANRKSGFNLRRVCAAGQAIQEKQHSHTAQRHHTHRTSTTQRRCTHDHSPHSRSGCDHRGATRIGSQWWRAVEQRWSDRGQRIEWPTEEDDSLSSTLDSNSLAPPFMGQIASLRSLLAPHAASSSPLDLNLDSSLSLTDSRGSLD